MQLEAMLDKCRREQWDVGDLDWSGTPRAMAREDELAIVQYFTDMAEIERLAGALFAEQIRHADDPILKEIFRSFVRDEARHARTAERLAAYYDVHRYRAYRVNPALARFAPRFVQVIRHLSADLANAYVTSGELILDIALLRSIDDHVGDAMSQRAMQLINRDESRHIAVDFHMLDYYGSAAYAERLRRQPPRSRTARLRASLVFASALYYAAPFFRDVFFEPMRVCDPSGMRMREAFKRVQLAGRKTTPRRHAFIKVLRVLQDIYNDSPTGRRVFGRLIERILGVDPEMIARLYTEAERRRAEAMSFDAMAEEALKAKYH